MTDDFTDRLTAVESTLESLATDVADDLGDADGANDSDAIGTDVEAIVTILREAEKLLDAIDVSELPDAIDGATVREAIELGEIPDALRGDDATVVQLRQVIRAIDLGRTLGAMDVTDVWESKRAIESATNELDDEDTGGALGGVLGGGDDDTGLLGGGDGVLDDVAGDLAEGDLIETDMDDVADTAADELKRDVDIADGDASEYQAVIQQQAIEGVDAFREALLKTHGTFERIVEANREKMRQQDRSPHSRNPTAASTIPTTRSDVASVPNYATMPRTVRHSDGPTRTHIYGDRFRREREKRGYD
ncbi:hypothetical protein [Halovivax cerinus]|uniref:Uncharacterized protein n=1 Tax=Halovivax cerinus TaxID=1487865 RepID=A0ABD5NNS4_9EURY|nr:hypothetical protein [Halovivax cerinus]